MATVSTVPARRREGPSGRRPGRGFGRRRWARPPRREPLLSVRRVVRGVGKTLIATGVLIFLFVAYELWGTGIAEARDQRALKAKLSQTLLAPPTTTAAAPTAAPPETVPPPVLGEGIAQIQAASIGLDKYVVEGVGTDDLKSGPGHYPDTPMPGEPGNAAIAGHRTTYGAPFNRLDELSMGDPILIRTKAGLFRYEVSEKKVVSPDEVSVLDNTQDNRLTLTTCNPKYSASQRLIVVAALVSTPLPAPPAPGPAGAAPEAPRPRSQLAGLSGDRAPRGPAIAWGALAALIWAATWAVGQYWRRWPAYFLGAPVFLLVLFVFFENFSRLLPANV